MGIAPSLSALALSILPLSFLPLSFLGCGARGAIDGTASANYREEVPDDAAMVRARRENETRQKNHLEPLTNAEAAHRYFYPRRIDNYFQGMDVIAAPADSPPEEATFAVLERGAVDQLLDRSKPTRSPRRLVDPVTTKNEILGRNTWMLWAGGNEGFWDWLANNSLGFMDLLKLVDSRGRSVRFRDAGLINEPGMAPAAAPDGQEFGLWLDIPTDDSARRFRREYLQGVFDRQLKAGQPAEPGYSSADAAGESPAVTSDYQNSAGGYSSGGDISAASTDPYATPQAISTPGISPLEIPAPEIYGLSSGVVGLRLFPNPNFDKEAAKKWNPERYYSDPAYYNNPKLIRPFRVGMSCAFCHASYHPLNPPVDLINPGWENLSGNIGAQYLRIRAVFGNLLTEDNFVYHLLDSQPPGTIDTSLIASDNINNPNTMNSVFNLPQRVLWSLQTPREAQSAASLRQPSSWGQPDLRKDGSEFAYGDDTVSARWAQAFLQATQALERLQCGRVVGTEPTAGAARNPSTSNPTNAATSTACGIDLVGELRESNGNPRRVPRVLLDGADSIGAWGALARVYLNIGTYYEQWNRLHTPLLGFTPQKPFTIDDSEAHSLYWHATQQRVGPLRDYFLTVSAPMPLLEAGDVRRRADGESFESTNKRRIDKSKLELGRQTFARNCIVCHSSIQPPERLAAMQRWADEGEFWDHDPGQWLRNPKYIEWALRVVEDEDFWRYNYLSTDYRVPVTVVRTNAGRAMATNAITGSLWEDFSSESYRTLPSVGAIDYFNPFLGKEGGEDRFSPRHKAPRGALEGGGGPGYYRVPSLVSIWSTAPLLHNNSLGLFNNDPSVEGRVAAFEDAIRKLLWPEKRLQSSSYNEATPARLRRDHGLIWRTTKETNLVIPGEQVPALLGRVPRLLAALNEIKRFLPLQDSTLMAKPWLPSAILLVLSFVLLFWAPHRWVRWGGIVALLLAVFTGFILYLLAGRIGDVRIGPIPQGTPVNLLANVNPDASASELAAALKAVFSTLAEVRSKHLDEAATATVMREEIAPALMKVSKSPDFVMDRGHFFEWFDSMSGVEKDALIELLKTF